MENQQEQLSGDSGAVSVDIPSLAQALEKELAVRHQLYSGGSEPCIPTIDMVHDLTRNVDEHEYNPHYVSIGPYHRKKTPNIIREDDKLTSLQTILSASRPGATVETYLAELAPIEGRARSFYAHRFSEIKSEEFLRMLLLDACYVLDWFGNGISAAANENSSPASAPGDGNIIARENHSPVANGPVEGGNQAASGTASESGGSNKLEVVLVVRDVLYLVENQIPYFVINKVHRLSSPEGRVPVVNAIAGCVSSRILQKQQYSMATVADGVEPGNLLHLLHMHFPKPTTEPYSAAGEPVGRCRSAMEYYINGVNFKSRKVGTGTNDARCILDVTMDRSSGTLALPHLRIDAETWRILRNLMALEQQNTEVGSHVTAYCNFMSQLACNEKDVALLSQSGVIVHLLGNNEEAAKLFSDLCKGVVFDANDPKDNYLRATCQALDELYRSRPRRWMALLVQKYFDNPWLVIGVMAATLGLLCTLVQAVYAVFSYYLGAAK